MHGGQAWINIPPEQWLEQRQWRRVSAGVPIAPMLCRGSQGQHHRENKEAEENCIAQELIQEGIVGKRNNECKK